MIATRNSPHLGKKVGGYIPCICKMSIKKLVLGGLFLISISTIAIIFLLPPENSNTQRHHFETDDGTVRQLLADLDVEDESINGVELKKRIKELLRIKGLIKVGCLVYTFIKVIHSTVVATLVETMPCL